MAKSINDRIFDLMFLAGQGLGERQNNGKMTAAREEAENLIAGGMNDRLHEATQQAVDAMVNGVDYRTALSDAFGFGRNQANNNPNASDAIINAFGNTKANDNSLGQFFRQNSAQNIANNLLNGNAQGNNTDTAQTNPYNASADYNVDLNNPYSMQIMNAKNDYYRAQKLGDENAMLQANNVAEQARQNAQANNVALPSYLATNNTDYGTALAMQDQLRQAQVNGNNNFSYTDLFGKPYDQQTMNNPTQGVNNQSPVNAGTAVPTAQQGVAVPTVGNQQTAQTTSAPNMYDVQAGWNLMQNRQNGGSANSPFRLGVKLN